MSFNSIKKAILIIVLIFGFTACSEEESTTSTNTSSTSTSSSYDSKILGTWTLSTNSGVTISFYSSKRGSNIINVTGYAKETRPYSWRISGNNLYFTYDETKKEGNPSQILGLTSTKLTLYNSDNTTGVYTKGSSSSSTSTTTTTTTNTQWTQCRRTTSTHYYWECQPPSSSCSTYYSYIGKHSSKTSCVNSAKAWLASK